MHRYAGEPLRESCRIALISSDALGNFVVATPLLAMIKARYPASRVTYFSGVRVAELACASSLVDKFVPLSLHKMKGAALKPVDEFDLVINLESTEWAQDLTTKLSKATSSVVGPCRGLAINEDAQGVLSQDPDWTEADLAHRHPILETGFISEIFARLAYFTGPVPRYVISQETPNLEIPDVLISMSASRTDKLWPTESWAEVLGAMQRRGFSVGLLGADPKAQGQYWHGVHTEDAVIARGLVEDLRGKLTLPEVTGALAKCRLALTLDNGILHLAASTQTPIVGLFRPRFHRLWAPPVTTLQVISPDDGLPVEAIPGTAVLEAVNRVL